MKRPLRGPNQRPLRVAIGAAGLGVLALATLGSPEAAATPPSEVRAVVPEPPLLLFVPLSEPLPFDLARLIELLRVELGGRSVSVVSAEGASVDSSGSSRTFLLAVIARANAAASGETLTLAVFDHSHPNLPVHGNTAIQVRAVALSDIEPSARARALALALSEMIPAPPLGADEPEAQDQATSARPSATRDAPAPPARIRDPPADCTSPPCPRPAPSRGSFALSGIVRNYPTGELPLFGPQLSACFSLLHQLELCTEGTFVFGDLLAKSEPSKRRMVYDGRLAVGANLKSTGSTVFSAGPRVAVGTAQIRSPELGGHEALVGHVGLRGEARRALVAPWAGLVSVEVGYALWTVTFRDEPAWSLDRVLVAATAGVGFDVVPTLPEGGR